MLVSPPANSTKRKIYPIPMQNPGFNGFGMQGNPLKRVFIPRDHWGHPAEAGC